MAANFARLPELLHREVRGTRMGAWHSTTQKGRRSSNSHSARMRLIPQL
jgi:hypothetical protein